MPEDYRPTRIVIMGAAGRDFHNFNMVYRDDPYHKVVAFTASQIPGISERRYPPSLSGVYYPDGIPILNEEELNNICRNEDIDEVIFAYSDIEHATVMQKASIALSSGADFKLLGPKSTMIKAELPAIAVSAVRTGCGKSPTVRWISEFLKNRGKRVGVIRHPMPYGDLKNQAVQCFKKNADLDEADCTIEEREEYEPHLAIGNTVYAGVDYEPIISQAQKDTDVLLWDGGNNDFPFLSPDLHIVLIDALRPGNENTHHPGETVLRMADVILIAKSNTAVETEIQIAMKSARTINPTATIIRVASRVSLDRPDGVQGKRALVIEDGPTITHGGMPFGAGYIAAKQIQEVEIVDPRESANAEISDIFELYPHISSVLPAMGYYPSQLKSLAQTINESSADVVVSGTPCDIGKLIKINKPILRASYEFAELEEPGLGGIIDQFLKDHKRGRKQ